MNVIFDYINVFLLVTAFLNFLLGILIYQNNSKKKINIVYSLNIIAIIAWSMAMVMYRSSHVDSNMFWGTILYIVPTTIASSFLYFTYIFPTQEEKDIRKKTFYIFGINALIVVMVAIPGLIIKEISVVPGSEKHIVFTGFYWFYFLYTAGFFTYGFKRLFSKYAKSGGMERWQVLYLLIGYSLAANLAFVTNLIMPWIGLYSLNWLGQLFTIIMVAFTAYSIVSYRLFDIRIIIKRVVIFTGLLVSMFTVYVAALIVFSSSLLGIQSVVSLTPQRILLSLIAGIIIAVTFDPLRRWLTGVVADRFLRGEYKQEDVLKSLAITLANVIDIDEAIKGMIQVVVDQMRLHKAVVFMLHPNGKDHEHEMRGVARVGVFDDALLKIAPQDVLIEYFEAMGIDHADLVVIEELKRMAQTASGNKFRESFIKRSELLEASVMMPLIISRQEAVTTAPGTPTQTKEVKSLIGILALGAKKSGDTFSDQDLKMLQIVANETAAAIEKGRFFEEDRLKTEFVSIASHELLTPTTSMKGYLSMILDEGIGKVDPVARGYLVKVYSETNRLAVLVKDLLNVSRIDRGKIVVELKTQDVLPLVQHAVETQELKAKEQKLSLKLELPKKSLPMVSVDSDKLLEVFINVIGNGLKYTKQGSVTVSFNVTPTQVMVSVTDTGIGIGPNDMQHLFGKFFRASNSDETGQTGTGLGLYVSKYMTELMGGTIAVDSVIGKGTTFTIILPVAKVKA